MGEHTDEVTTFHGGEEQMEFPFMTSKPAAIIGLIGKRGSGKNTVAEVAKGLDASVVEMALGDFVKDEVAKAIDHSHVWVDEHKEQLRPLLQVWGTEWRRNLCDENYWLRRLAEQLNTVPDESIVFVTDLRFANEVQFIRDRGGVVVKVERPTLMDRAPETVDLHCSELNMDRFKVDAKFMNNGTSREAIRKGVESLIGWALEKTKQATPLELEPSVN